MNETKELHPISSCLDASLTSQFEPLLYCGISRGGHTRNYSSPRAPPPCTHLPPEVRTSDFSATWVQQFSTTPCQRLHESLQFWHYALHTQSSLSWVKQFSFPCQKTIDIANCDLFTTGIYALQVSSLVHLVKSSPTATATPMADLPKTPPPSPSPPSFFSGYPE